jgi:hypothetical protein
MLRNPEATKHFKEAYKLAEADPHLQGRIGPSHLEPEGCYQQITIKEGGLMAPYYSHISFTPHSGRYLSGCTQDYVGPVVEVARAIISTCTVYICPLLRVNAVGVKPVETTLPF